MELVQDGILCGPGEETREAGCPVLGMMAVGLCGGDEEVAGLWQADEGGVEQTGMA